MYTFVINFAFLFVKQSFQWLIQRFQSSWGHQYHYPLSLRDTTPVKFSCKKDAKTVQLRYGLLLFSVFLLDMKIFISLCSIVKNPIIMASREENLARAKYPPPHPPGQMRPPKDPAPWWRLPPRLGEGEEEYRMNPLPRSRILWSWLLYMQRIRSFNF